MKTPLADAKSIIYAFYHVATSQITLFANLGTARVCRTITDRLTHLDKQSTMQTGDVKETISTPG